MKCPRDGWVLHDGELGGVAAHRCSKCDGFFFELGINAGKRFSFAPEELNIAARDLPFGALNSPVSGNPMRVFHHRGVELDYCEAVNAIWLDRGEWEKLTIQKVPFEGKKLSNERNPLLEGLDIAFSGVEILDFVGDAIGALFDGF